MDEDLLDQVLMQSGEILFDFGLELNHDVDINLKPILDSRLI